MCGICGFIGKPNPKLISRMCNLILHRGPDDEGTYSDGLINLGMRRLSIIDLRTGKQPICNETRDVWVVYNGEIFNFIELRVELEDQGHRFSTKTDTEVIVHLYEEYGEEFVHKLNGMFAIALWDKKEQTLLLYRDRVGIKPLYFALLNGNIVFGSEIKAILAYPGYEKKINYEALHHYFSFKNIPAPLTIFEGIEALSPGEYLKFQRGEANKKTYWQINFTEQDYGQERFYTQKIMDILADSVQRMMVSDVPIGAYLSGGVDSSAVVALMSKFSTGSVLTFSLGYEDEFKNKAADIYFARQVSRMYHTEHYEYIMSSQEIPESIEEIIASFDQPFSGVISTFFISKLVKKHVKVALSGDGSDELFASYLAPRLAQPIHHYLTYRQHGEVDQLEAHLLAPFEDRLEYIARIAEPEDWRWRAKLHVFTEQEKQSLFSDKFKGFVKNYNTDLLLKSYFDNCTSLDTLNRVLEVDFNKLLPDQVLNFVDKLSMVHSIEVRPPFLDHRLVEFVATIPSKYKIKNGVVKYILKQAVNGLLSPEIIERPKEGFIMPVNAWLMDKLKLYVKNQLQPQRLSKHGFLKQEYIDSLINEHYAQKANHANKLWNLMMFQAWYEKMIT